MYKRQAQSAEKIRVRPGFDPECDMGPLVSEEQLNRVCGYLESGKKEGAKAVTGGQRHGDKGYFVKPTVLVDTTENMKVVQEEIFGPVDVYKRQIGYNFKTVRVEAVSVNVLSERDIVVSVERRQQIELLKNESDFMAPQERSGCLLYTSRCV